MLRGDLLKLEVIIDDVEIMNHIVSNQPEEYKNTAEVLEDELDDDIDMLTIEKNWEILSAKYDRMNERSNQNEGK